jgi:hypothetical protein
MALATIGSGCGRGEGLVIATNWTEAECAALVRDIPARITWLRVAPGEDPTRVLDRPVAIDVVLGGPASSYRRLAAAGRLGPVDRQGRAGWRVARRSPVGLGINRPAREAQGAPTPQTWDGLSAPGLRGLVALDDPRSDPVALAWAKARLGSGRWADGYAELVRTAGNARRIGLRGGSAEADLRRGAAAFAPGRAQAGDDLAFVAFPGGAEFVEGVALARGARDRGRALAVLERVAGPAPEPSATAGEDPRADPLLADLLGATLVEAQDELWDASEALARAGMPGHTSPRLLDLSRWMVESPPWPPASIQALREEGSDPLIEALADQIATDPGDRDWLMESWSGPVRRIDGGVLDALARGDGGRMAANSRFRAWLRGEWTAWARQRYRRVAREGAKEARR